MTIETRQEQEKVTVSLRYEGPEVHNGSMPLDKMLKVLDGFTDAYGEIAAKNHPGATHHQFYISDIRPGSIEFALELWEWAKSNEEGIQAALIPSVKASSYCFKVLEDLFDLIRLIKHIAKKDFEQRPSGPDHTIVENYYAKNLKVSKKVYNINGDQRIKSRVYKTVEVLNEDEIDKAEFTATAPDGRTIRQNVTAKDRPNFEPDDIKEIITQKRHETVTLNSLAKSTNKGTLRFNDGNLIKFTYKGDHPEKLYSIFGSENEPIKATCELRLNPDKKVIHADIYDVEPLTNVAAVQNPLIDYQ